MKRALKTLTAGALLGTMVLGLYGAASAETANEGGTAASKSAAVSAALAEGKPVIFYHREGSLLQNPVHERNYLLLLVKAYAPGNAAEWNAAFEERKQAESAMPKPMLLEKNVILKKDIAAAGDVKKELRLGVPMKEIPNPGKLKDDIMKKELPAELKLQDDFAKAVEAGDDAAIKELLPKLLETYKKQTADMKTVAEKLKQAGVPAQTDHSNGK